jgi:hypothetical protein
MLFFRPEFHALSNGALVFAVSLMYMMHGKLDKTIHGNYACIPISSIFSI